MIMFCYPRRAQHRLILLIATLVVSCFLLASRRTLYTAWTLAALPFTWGRGAEQFVLSQDVDGFDVTFARYNVTQTSSTSDGYGFRDRVPPILHHVLLGAARGDGEGGRWTEARQSCLDLHPGWEAHLWTDETAGAFVAENFPELKAMWDGYPYLIQRVDALRHMLLYAYGGVVLDMDLRCRRSLGPLRRFGFVAPEAHPVGVSVGFVMAERHNPLVGAVVHSLRTYNRRWLGLPYPTIMFSTGCHFVSTIHSLQENRSDYKVLRGPPENPRLHQVNGAVSTPLFDHLGSSAWHNTLDCLIIVLIGRSLKWLVPALVLFVVGGLVFAARRRWRMAAERRSAIDSGSGDGSSGGFTKGGRARKASEVDLEDCPRPAPWMLQQLQQQQQQQAPARYADGFTAIGQNRLLR
ncbi:glycosyltransferase family 32 protein [Niveomyces insectorum RCEF 264]|uniref:Glycosyltransferase family 32 protein n=1 Tax=Niveomyces insectorum RCEF 264 TaxID=1081102 RepID=A0A162J295_9HYPO|nr:glycosyltransferase family 32 protein [Niveomyces insectorum RCEF 264]